MDNNEIILTPEGRKRLVEELEFREGAKNDEIVERLKDARGFGDLSENAEFDAAKEEQAQNASRINEIRHILASARVVEAGASLAVGVGATAKLADEKGKERSFTIVGTTETNSLKNEISNESPLGAALIGRVVGDTISYVTPTGKTREYKLVGISREERESKYEA